MILIGTILSITLRIYSFILIARVLLTYIPNLDPTNPIVKGLYSITEPILQPVRERLPQNNYNMDFSPLAVFAVIFILQIFVQAIFL